MRAHRAYFEETAESYDDYTGHGRWTPNEVLEVALTSFVSSEVRTVLDLGTGTGQTLEVVARIFPGARLVGSDLSPAMLAHAARRIPQAELVEGDLETVVRAGTTGYDLVTAVGCLELIPHPLEVLPYLVARANPGGLLAITFQPSIIGLAGHDRPTHQLGEQASVGNLTTAEVLGALPGCALLDSQLFLAYHRNDGQPVVYELLVARRAI